MNYILLLFSFFILSANLLFAQQKHEYTVSAYATYDFYNEQYYYYKNYSNSFLKGHRTSHGFSLGSKFGVRNRRTNYWQFGGFYSYIPSYYKCSDCPREGLSNPQGHSPDIYESKYREHTFTITVDFTYEYLKSKNLNLYFSVGELFRFMVFRHNNFSYWRYDFVTRTIDPGPYYGKYSDWGDWSEPDFGYNFNTGAEFSLSNKLNLFIEPSARVYCDYNELLNITEWYKGFSINLLAGIKFKELKKKKEEEK